MFQFFLVDSFVICFSRCPAARILSVTSFQHSYSSGFVVLTQAVVHIMGGKSETHPY